MIRKNRSGTSGTRVPRRISFLSEQTTRGSEGIRIMKKVVILLLITIMVLAICACTLFHQHTWRDATCTEPKTCIGCGETEGEALGHTWVDATCIEPKTCSVCGATEGGALGHTWVEATCTEPKTCSVCGATEGEALGHTWAEATCTEPKTCSVCSATEGEALGHTAVWEIKEADIVAATRIMKLVCSVCGEELDLKEETIQTFIDGKRFVFTPQEFIIRLQNAWDEQHPDFTLKFKYTILSKGSIAFDILNQHDAEIGFGMFYDEEGYTIKIDAADIPVNACRVIVEQLDDVDVGAMLYMIKQLSGPIVQAIDPMITDGSIYKDAVSSNLFEIDNKPLNGLHYTCGYEKDSGYMYIDIDIAY